MNDRGEVDANIADPSGSEGMARMWEADDENELATRSAKQRVVEARVWRLTRPCPVCEKPMSDGRCRVHGTPHADYGCVA